VNQIEIILEGGPFDGQTRELTAGSDFYTTALKAVTPETPQELRGLFWYRRAGELRDRRPVFRYLNPADALNPFLAAK